MLYIWWVRQTNWFSLLFVGLYENMADFFAEILEDREDSWATSYIVTMFFVILLYNLLWLLTDFISPIFGFNAQGGEFYLADYIAFWTSDYHFTIAMAAVGVLLTLWVQFFAMSGTTFKWKQVAAYPWMRPIVKGVNFIHEYVPILGKDILSVERGGMNPLVYGLLFVVIKVLDIAISLFIGLLDIIWTGAKIISLWFRLFGNMMSWTALLSVLIVWLNATTSWRFGQEFPILGPLILLVQWLLVACVQAFVFPLLVAIFLKVAKMSSEEDTTMQSA